MANGAPIDLTFRISDTPEGSPDAPLKLPDPFTLSVKGAQYRVTYEKGVPIVAGQLRQVKLLRGRDLLGRMSFRKGAHGVYLNWLSAENMTSNNAGALTLTSAKATGARQKNRIPFGSIAMNAFFELAKQNGIKTIELTAAFQSNSFYTGLGFEVDPSKGAHYYTKTLRRQTRRSRRSQRRSNSATKKTRRGH